MLIYSTLTEAKIEGKKIAKHGSFPTIYKGENCEYFVIERNEMPPSSAWPLLKWAGILTGRPEDMDSEWVPILARLDSIETARDACCLFKILGYEPVIVKYHNRSAYDIFLKESHVPPGCWIVIDASMDGSIIHIQPSPLIDDDEFEIEVDKSL